MTMKSVPKGKIRLKLLGTDQQGKQSTRIVCLLVDDYRKLIEDDASAATVPGRGDRTRK